MVRMLAISEVSGSGLIVSKSYTATLAEARELSPRVQFRGNPRH